MGIIVPEIRNTAPKLPKVSLLRKAMNFLFDVRPYDPPGIYFGSTLGCDLPPVLPPGEVLFAEKVRQSGDVNQILESFQHEIQPTYSGPELTPFIKILLKRAKSFYLIEKDLDASLKIWRYLYEQNINGENEIVIHSMITLAKELAAGIPFKDLEAAIQIWTAAFHLDSCIDHSTNTLRSIVGAANKLTDSGLSSAQRDFESAFKLWECAVVLSASHDQRKAVRSSILHHADRIANQREIDDAIKIWQFLYSSAKTNGEKKHVIRIMMSYIRFFSDFNRPKQEMDIDLAIKLWKALYAFNHSADEKDHIVRNMLSVASLFSTIDFTKKEWDISAAVKIWKLAFSLTDERGKLVITMENTAKKLAEPMPPNGERDVDSAILIWRELFEMDFPVVEKRYLFTYIFSLANQLVALHLPAAKKETENSVKLWHFLYNLSQGGEKKLEVIKGMMKVAHVMTDTEIDLQLRDIDCGIAIWRAVFDLNFSSDQNDRIIAIMILAAKRLAFEKQDWANAQKIRQAAEELRARLFK